MLPFTFDLKPQDLHYVDRTTLPLKFALLERHMLDCKLMGLDTETRPNFTRNKQVKQTALLQIATRNRKDEEAVFIIDLLSLKADKLCLEKVDEVVSQAFANKDCVKIGQGLANDMRELCNSYPVMSSFREMNAVVEGNEFLKVLEPSTIQLVSLKKIVKRFLNCNLVKTQQCSNWYIIYPL